MVKKISRRKLFGSLPILGLGGVAASAVRIPEALAQTGGARVAFRTDTVTTNSTSFADVPGMAVVVDFNRPFSELVVIFSAEVLTSVVPDGRMNIRALDGDTVLEPGEVNIITRQGDIQSRSFTFFRSDAPLGTRLVRVQWRMSSGVGTVRMDSRSMVALLTAVP
jgi:hypothetical protein